MGSIAPVVMSLIVFSGAAQFAALTVLTAGGGALAAIARGDADERRAGCRWGSPSARS